MRLLAASVVALTLLVGAAFADGRPAVRHEQGGRLPVEPVTVGWLRLRVPPEWSVRGDTGGTVVATPVSSGWSRAVSVTAAPFELPVDLGRHQTAPSIPPRSYQVWIYASRLSRHGARPGSVRPTVSSSDQVAPPPGVGIQFTRTLRLADRWITAVVSMDRDADVRAALEEANQVVRTLTMTE